MRSIIRLYCYYSSNASKYSIMVALAPTITYRYSIAIGDGGYKLYAPDSAKVEDSSIVDEPGEGCEPLCARIESANREVSEGKAHFSSYEGPMERRTGKIRGAFSWMRRALDGWMLARAPASPAQGLHHYGPRYFIFPYFCTMCGLEKRGIVDQNWLERIEQYIREIRNGL